MTEQTGMYERFAKTGEGRRRLITALRTHPLAQGREALATALADAGDIRRFAPGEVLISQGGHENALFLICAGRVSVLVHGREVATRGPGDHVGEMALLEPSAPRSATLQAVEETVAVEVPEEQLDALAREYPDIWHSMARVLAARLRERGNLVAARAERPRLFIGSSSEGKDVAQAVQSALANEMHAEVWTDNIFAPTSQTLESLERRLPNTDFAVLVLTADDVVRSRGKQKWVPRDNVVLEVGFFCGALGRGRTFLLVASSEVDLKLPSDLFGLTYLTLAPGSASDLQARVGPACTQIRTTVRAAGPR